MRIENGIVCARGDEMQEFMEWAKEQLDYEAMSFKQAVEKYVEELAEQEQTMFDLRFCYRISEKAKMAHDEYGNPAECFAQIKLNDCKNPPEDYDAAHKKMGVSLAKEIGISPEWVIPISEEEYDAEMDEEGEEDE
ncbi:hypothetical protein [Paenibacillus thiaminolyticus]|uniref:hypothetical protein n=1 Tax=Paenibacillus thiaminolyticus TaxID=49283 RepID=UPI002542A8CE|nr:hypothetical protein [Paenibacillus thiaminolyticus]WII39685.1 hypothetical protein O0V01_11565 [Paenibacillus thiaminolyticus]